MIYLIRLLTAPLISLIFMMIGSGLFNTFISLRLKMDGITPEVIGLVTSSLYVGILVGSLKIDRWISRVGLIRSFVPLTLILASLAIFQGLWVNPWYWSGLRFLGGICSAGVLIIFESWFLMQCTPNMRGRVLSLYLATLYGALSMGQLLLNVPIYRGFLPYFITALFALASIFPVLRTKVQAPKLQETPSLNLAQLYRISPLGFIGGIISGMILAVVYGLVPVFADEIGMSVSEIGFFMAMIIFGGLSLQWPVGKWADRGKRQNVIKIISFITAGLGISITMVSHLWMLYLLAFLFGGFAFTLYPLCMAHACERVKESEIVAVTGGFVLSYGFGAILGPLLAPIAMSLLGSVGVFYFLGFISMLLGLIGLKKPSPAF